MNTIINNIKTNYIVQGSGETILLLHGWGTNITLFQPMIAHLSAHHTVYALDLPGFGETSEPPFAWSVNDYADFVFAFLKKMNLTKVMLLGHSNGGRIITKMVTRNPLPIEVPKIIFLGAAGIKPKKTFRQKLKVRTYKIGKSILQLKPIQVLYPDALENMRKRSGSADYNAASPLMRQVLVKTVNEDLTHLLPFISSPTLLIWGENDTATPLPDGQKMEQLIKGSGLVTVKNAGHYVFLDQMALVHKVLDSFLENKE